MYLCTSVESVLIRVLFLPGRAVIWWVLSVSSATSA